jgi:hypothetical protein
MSWIGKISEGIQRTFSVVRKPLTPLPPILLIGCANNRPGLSAISLASAIIKRLPEAGIETGVNNDGSPNKINQFVRILCEELIQEIKDNARVTCVIEQGKINSYGTGASASGPVVVTSINTIPVTVSGIIQ